MNKLSPLHETHQRFLEAAPETFSSKQAKEICLKLGLKERWFDVALRKRTFYELFARPNHGWYRKK